MKKSFKSVLAVAATAVAVAGIAAVPALVSAYGPERQTYSMQQVDEGILGNEITFNSIVVQDSDYAWHKNTKGVEIPSSTILNELNFVGAREDTGVNQGGANIWKGNDIEVEDGKTYIVRMYVHNNAVEDKNNPDKTTAKDVHTKFFLPEGYDTKHTINGQISASNTMYEKYWDYVNFVSKDGTPFKIEFISESANLENNHFQHTATVDNSYKLSDEIVTGKDGVMIGYDSMNGRIPGCYQYSTYIGIKVKVTYQPQFIVEKKVRLADDSDKTWKKSVDAKVGDKVEFMIQYKNTSNFTQYQVGIKDILPNNLRYIEGSAKIKNEHFPEGATLESDSLVTTGLNAGNYGPGANVFFMFTAEVVDNSLACGSNTLVNWSQAATGDVYEQDYARVVLNKVCENNPTPEEPKTDNPVDELPTTGPEAVAGGIIAVGSIATAAGYFIVSRRQLR